MKQDIWKYIAALSLFGSNGVVASFISLDSIEIVFLRTMIGSLLVITVFWLQKRSFEFFRCGKRPFFLIVSGIAMGIGWVFLYEAYRQVGVGIASLTYYCGPIIVMTFSPIIFHEKLSTVQALCFLIVLSGVLLVNGQAFQAGKNIWGIFCGMMSAVMYAVMVIFNRKADASNRMENSVIQLTASFLTVTAFMIFYQRLPVNVTMNDWGPILLLGIFNTGVGCWLYFSSIGNLPIYTVAVCGYLEPLAAVVFSVLILRESMLPIQSVKRAWIWQKQILFL